MTKLEQRLRAFAPKARSGCRTCRQRRVKCDEAKPGCNRCTIGRRKCEWYQVDEEPSLGSKQRTYASTPKVILPKVKQAIDKIPTVCELQPHSLGGGLNDGERRAVEFFLCRTALDIDNNCQSTTWLMLSIQIGQQEQALRYAIAATGAMQLAREMYTHTSLSPIIEKGRHQKALHAYSNAMMHLRKLIQNCDYARDPQSPVVVLLCCLLFFVLEMVQGDTATGCLHMVTGQRIIKELSGSDSPRKFNAVLQADVRNLFDGFEELHLSVFGGRRVLLIQSAGRSSDHISTLHSFNTIAEAHKSLRALETARQEIQEELLQAGDHAFRELTVQKSHPGAMLCLQYGLSRLPHQTSRDRIVQDIQELTEKYSTWQHALEESTFLRQKYPRAISVLEMQSIAGILLLRTCRNTDEMYWDSLEHDLERVLHLAENFLFHGPVTTQDCSLLGSNPNAMVHGYDFTLNIDLLSHIFLVGVKSRRNSTRQRVLKLLKSTNKTEGIHSSWVLYEFIKRICDREASLAGLPENASNMSDESFTIPQHCRLLDIVFSKVENTLGGARMTCMRFVDDGNGTQSIEVIDDVFDLIKGVDVSYTTYSIPLPETV